MADNTEKALLHERAGHTENTLPNAPKRKTTVKTERYLRRGGTAVDRNTTVSVFDHLSVGGGEIFMEDLKNSDPPEQVTALWQS